MLSIIIPTYNEAPNIEPIIQELCKVLEENDIDGELIIVDDDSPDGTGDIAKGLEKDGRLQVIVRKDERGLSSAVLEGFGRAQGELLMVMDCDMSHPPAIVPDLIAPLLENKAEMVIGSRYVKGGGVSNWPLRRKVISRGATLLAKSITSVKDPMSGLFALRREVIEGVQFNPRGYKIGLEILARGNYQTVVEVPFTFKDRAEGESKLDSHVMRDYLGHLFSLFNAKNSHSRYFIKFSLVGASGTLVNLAVLYTLVELLNIWYIFGAIGAFLVANLSNYLFNKVWTFQDGTSEPIMVFGLYLRFVTVSAVGLSINLACLYTLVENFGLYFMFAQIIAIGCALLWNFTASRAWVFNQ